MRGRRFGALILARRELHILRDIYQDRTWASGCRHVEGLMYRLGQRVGFLHQPVMFGARAGDAYRVSFLKSVRADHEGRHLAGEYHKWDRIHQRVSQTRYGICRARAGCDQHNTRFAGGPGIAFGGMHRTLFMAYQNVPNVVLLKDFVINR